MDLFLPCPAPRPVRRRRLIAGLAALLAAGSWPSWAASTGDSALHMPQGPCAGTANGDYVTASTGGLNTFYRYFIEVPSGLGRLTVEVFDADVGVGGSGEGTAGRDRDRDGGSLFNTTATYTLLKPDGTTAATLTCTDATCTDNAWNSLFNATTGLTAGHWELRVALSGTTCSGNNQPTDIDAIGVRAHDGTSGAGGTELPVYIDSIVQLGVNPPASGSGARSYTLYPYVTYGCTASSNDFDYDSNEGTVGSIALSSRTGSYTQTINSASLSTNNTWARNTINRWTSDQLATEYGIWTGSITIDTYTVGGVVNGNYTDVYFANSAAAANPPTANPVTNAFRMYLPTDAGSAPVKPYVEQLLTFKSGTNPPGVGQTAKYQVTVRVVNPTAKAITFSASNLVTANVPGSGATYAGSAAVGQGTIVSQPSVGGTGNITWNPGTLAAGATTILTYQVNVTPTSAGQRIPVTGTPASNGTTAKYLDETGGTQARATFTFGPLCELAVTQGLLTEVVVSGFHASPADGGGVLLEWQTASEAGTAGFYVQRWDRAAKRWQRVDRELLAGLLHAPQGGTYRFVDPEASPNEPQLYRLVEVEAGGGRHTYGPFAAQVDWSRRDPRQSPTAYERGAHPPTRRGEATEPLALKAAAVRGFPDGVHLSVRQTGLYYLSAADVGSWLGLKPDEAVKAIAQGKVNLTKSGQPVAWYPDLAGTAAKAQGLFFYGQAPDSPYTTSSVYRLVKGAGLLMQTVPAGTAAPTAGGSFPDTRHAEQDLFAATVISPDPDSDYWYWQFLQGNDPTYGHRTFTLDAPGLAAAGGGTLAVNLQGATASGFTDEHQAQVSLNGTPLGQTSWTGITPQPAVFSVPAGLLLESGNQVDVTAVTGGGAPYSIWYVDSFDLSYPRLFRAAGDSLTFTAGGSPRVSVGGFTNPAVRLIDVQDPLHPRWITGAAASPDGAGGSQVSFVPAATGRYVAAAPAALLAPAAVRGWSAPSLLSAANRADYVVVAPASMRDAAERLADTRRAQGMAAIVADLDQIMDTFNGGVSDPRAIRTFLGYAHTQWSQGPRYVALAGAGTYDYRNLLGFGDNLLPPLMIQTGSGLFPSDNQFGDVDGDGLPEVAVGRIPVLSSAELDAYTAKLSGYESAAPANWMGTAVMTADDTDRGADFGADSDEVAGQIPPAYQVSRVYLKDLPLAAARGQLMAAIGGGTAFLNYMGHGALDRLSAGGLLTSADVPGLGNNGRLPVLTAMTCTINRFEVPGIPSLGEELAKNGGGGAAAVWGPTGLSANGEAKLLAARFYHAADARLGDRLLRAIADFRTLGGNPDLPRLYVLLGDPALRLTTPPPAAVSDSSPGE